MGALSGPGAAPGERIAFLTGKLAEPALRALVDEVARERGFQAEVVALNIAVAALMTADWAARRLTAPPGIARLVVPGYLTGDLRALEAAAGAPCVRGPKDLRELPRFLGAEGAAAVSLEEHAIEIIAEVNHVPRLTRDEVLAAARALRADGADIIDLGCDPGGPFAGIADLVRALRDEGMRVSVDSLDPAEFVPAVAAGAELVLSINSDNVDAARDLGAEVVAIPDEPSSLSGLEATVATLDGWGGRYRIDPVLEPIGFGFARSLGRYIAVRDRYPQAEMLFGIGNLTELTDADTAPINLALLGFCEELGIRSVLTTQVIHWARTCVRELDLARRLVHHAVQQKRLPKHVEPRLHLLRDAASLEHGQEALERLGAALRDRNFRLFAERGAIHVLAAGLRLEGTDPFQLFAQMGVADPSHAFYLGYEMAKAVTALTLGKNYVQDEALRWGFLTVEEKSHLARRAAEGEAQHGEGTAR